MTIDEFEKRVAETINDTKPAKVAGGKERVMTDLDEKLAPHLYGLREAGYDYVVYVMQSIKSLIKEEIAKARIDELETLRGEVKHESVHTTQELINSRQDELKKELDRYE